MGRFGLLFVLTLAGCSAPVPPEFESAEHKFRARFGAPPRVYDKPDGTLATQIFTVEAPDGALSVRAYKLPISDDEARRAADTILNEAKADLVRSVGGTETESASVALMGKYPGLRVVATADKPRAGVLRARVFLAGARLYKVSAFGTPDFADAPAARAFLESFAVLE